jgi:hypothetical protein
MPMPEWGVSDLERVPTRSHVRLPDGRKDDQPRVKLFCVFGKEKVSCVGETGSPCSIL